MTHSEPEPAGPAVDRFAAAYVAGATVTAAATRAGISRSTGTRLLRDPRVVEQIRQLRADMRRRVVDKLAVAQDIAVATLVAHASADHIAPTASSAVTAARALLSEGRAWTELQDLRDRIGDLEAALATGPQTEDREARLAALRLRLAEIDGDDAPAGH